MADEHDLQVGTYRCPVCGHRDTAEVEGPEGRTVITCSYCDTSLEVRSRGAGSVRFSVQVAGQPAA